MFIACGLNHKTAPLDIREQFARPTGNDHAVLHQFLTRAAANEAALLSTCNRTEIYCHTTQPTEIIPALAHLYDLSPQDITPYLYTHHETDGIRHALRVASGLDSMMLGEPQILGQMKDAYRTALDAGTMKQSLQPVFEHIFKATKRIRTQSGIGKNPISVAYAAVQLLNQHIANLPDSRVFIIGSGDTSSLVAKYLLAENVSQFMVASRTLHHAERLADKVMGQVIPVNDIQQVFHEADIIITATTCPVPFITQSLVEDTLAKRQNKPLFFLDLAVPRDIEPDVTQLPGVQVYTVDDLETITDQGRHARQTAAVEAEHLITLELEHFLRKHRAAQAKDVIREYRKHMTTLAESELKRALNKLANGECQTAVMEELTHRLLNKLTHAPTLGLHEAARASQHDVLNLVSSLLDLNTTNETIA